MENRTVKTLTLVPAPEYTFCEAEDCKGKNKKGNASTRSANYQLTLIGVPAILLCGECTNHFAELWVAYGGTKPEARKGRMAINASKAIRQKKEDKVAA